MASFAVPYFVIVGLYDLSLERFVLPLLPICACLSAYGVGYLLERAAARFAAASVARRILPATAGILPALALVPAWQLGNVRSAPDTFARAAACIEKNARPREDRIVIVPSLDLPLLHGEESLRENAKHPMRSNWVRYQMQLGSDERSGPDFEVYVSPKSIPEAQRALQSDPMGYFGEIGARYVVLAIDADPTQLLGRVRQVLRANGELVCRESPQVDDDGGGTNFFYRYQTNPWKYPFFRFVMRMKCMGSTLEVYRLR